MCTLPFIGSTEGPSLMFLVNESNAEEVSFLLGQRKVAFSFNENFFLGSY